jgi:hypothetical protein
VTVSRGNPSAISDAAEIPTTGESTMLLGPAPLGRAGRALQAAVVLACPAWCLRMPFLERARSRRRGRQREPVERPALLPAGMRGDRAQVIFAGLDDLKRFLVERC